jgi:putative heme-binding domain-containing protein
LSTVVGARADADEVGDLLKTLQWANLKEPTWWRLVALHGLADGMGSRGKQLGEFLMPLKPQQRYVVDLTMKLLAGMAILATDGKRELPDRLAAVRLLAHVSWDTAQPALTTLLKGDQPQELRLAAVRALAAHPRPEVPALLLKSWRSYTPAVRREVTAAMLRQTDRILFLLREVEKGRIKPGDLDTTRSKQLVNHKNPDIRDLARKLLQQNLPADRKEVLERYRAALSLKGDPQRGRVVFEKNCATCHRVAGVGVDVGPDVSDTRGKTLEALLTDVLNPNQAIDSNYVDYVVTTKSGKSLTGLIATETASSITLKRAENQTETVLRSDIESIQSTGVSLMPEGLEKTITVQEMADLLHFLKNWRYLDGKVPVKGG